MKKGKAIMYVGGTVSHISPHFALCAPAYGEVGDLFKSMRYLTIYKTKMAGGKLGIETTQDLQDHLCEQLKDNQVKVVIMAAAICDFDPSCMVIGDQVVTEFGKKMPRLSSKTYPTVHLTPSQKVVDIIKHLRPDVQLVTFKTTAGASLSDMVKKGGDNLKHSLADICFVNDIVTKVNFLLAKEPIFQNNSGDGLNSEYIFQGTTRGDCVHVLTTHLSQFSR